MPNALPWIKAVARLFPPLAIKRTSHTLAGVKIPVSGVFCNPMWSLKVPTPFQQGRATSHHVCNRHQRSMNGSLCIVWSGVIQRYFPLCDIMNTFKQLLSQNVSCYINCNAYCLSKGGVLNSCVILEQPM